MKKWLKKLANNLKAAPKMPTVIGFAYWALINVLFTHGEALYKLSIDKTSLLAVAQFEVASLICAIVLANLIARFIRKAKTDTLYRKFLKRAVIYFAISIAFLLLVYPGLYQFDDTKVLAAAQSYQVSAWQHFFSSLHDSMSLMLIPIACAPIIFSLFLDCAHRRIRIELPATSSSQKRQETKVYQHSLICNLFPSGSRSIYINRIPRRYLPLIRSIHYCISIYSLQKAAKNQ